MTSFFGSRSHGLGPLDITFVETRTVPARDLLSLLLETVIPQEVIDEASKNIVETINRVSAEVWEAHMGNNIDTKWGQQVAKAIGKTEKEFKHLLTVNLCMTVDEQIRNAIVQDLDASVKDPEKNDKSSKSE